MSETSDKKTKLDLKLTPVSITSEQLKEHKEKMDKMRTGRIDKKYLHGLLMDYKADKAVDPDAGVGNELAEVLLICIDKVAGMGHWRNYSDEWKDDMRWRATELLLKYCHGYDPEKVRNDPFNYLFKIINRAFIQAWRKCKEYEERFVSLNDELFYSSCEGMDPDDISLYDQIHSTQDYVEEGFDE